MSSYLKVCGDRMVRVTVSHMKGALVLSRRHLANTTKQYKATSVASPSTETKAFKYTKCNSALTCKYFSCPLKEITHLTYWTLTSKNHRAKEETNFKHLCFYNTLKEICWIHKRPKKNASEQFPAGPVTILQPFVTSQGLNTFLWPIELRQLKNLCQFPSWDVYIFGILF